MILFADQEYIQGIKKLWQEVFGDAEEDIDHFLAQYWNCMLIYTEHREVLGMLSMLPLKMGMHSGRYIYAVATSEKARNRGISTKLLQYANETLLKNGEEFSVLVPAEKSLYGFYQKRGYTPIFAVRVIETDDLRFPNQKINVHKIKPDCFFELRHRYFSSMNFIEWGLPEIEYISRIYDGNLYEITSDEGYGFAVCASYQGVLDIKELCVRDIDESECIRAINALFNAEHCRAVLPYEQMQNQRSVPNAMIYPESFQNAYFNLAMD